MIYILLNIRRVISGDMVVGSHGKTVNAIATAFILSAESNKLSCIICLSLGPVLRIRCIKYRLLFFSTVIIHTSRSVSCETRWWYFIDLLWSSSCSSYARLFLHWLFLFVLIQVSFFFLYPLMVLTFSFLCLCFFFFVFRSSLRGEFNIELLSLQRQNMLRYKGRFKSEQAVSVYEHFRQGLCFCCKVNPLFCKFNLSFFFLSKRFWNVCAVLFMERIYKRWIVF